MKIKKTSGDYPLIVTTSAGTVEFDKNGIAEAGDEAGELLLTIPGYEEVKTRGSGKKEDPNVPPAMSPTETTGAKSDENNQPLVNENTPLVSDPADADSKKTTKAGK